MIILEDNFITASVINQDKRSANIKNTIDIQLTEFDVSQSAKRDSIKLNFSKNEITVLNDGISSTVGDIYFTPVYTEKIRYDVWKTVINKSFQELEVE